MNGSCLKYPEVGYDGRTQSFFRIGGIFLYWRGDRCICNIFTVNCLEEYQAEGLGTVDLVIGTIWENVSKNFNIIEVLINKKIVSGWEHSLAHLSQISSHSLYFHEFLLPKIINQQTHFY